MTGAHLSQWEKNRMYLPTNFLLHQLEMILRSYNNGTVEIIDMFGIAGI